MTDWNVAQSDAEGVVERSRGLRSTATIPPEDGAPDASTLKRCQRDSLAPPTYSFPRVIHRSEESPPDLLPAASVNNSAAGSLLAMSIKRIFPNPENTHRPATNSLAGRWTPSASPSSQAMRWSLTNTQWRTALLSRSHYKPFAGISQRVFGNL